ncbi:DUF4229 domain-containing protein [Nonomuraea roseoviolacea]|uniref:Membrane protein implicated in regulation of membrane protease activity n=1 Tax=Nonomuraea roseoviolacea subsp. carminata TaxID=160689 RepID=A0ABT1JYI1_9ACTN|nr:DUF4229 domain-containing protein [Nonomuraea roseoviolacea]MCP2346796.1 membrane protein implicated in regulation of membrane protease activity [Nonomuraea roseoviolacea subsp. carminata]
MRPVLVYTLLRIVLFLVTAGLLFLLGLQNLFWLIVVSFLVSGVVSYVVLSKWRDAMSSRLTNKIDRPKPNDG